MTAFALAGVTPRLPAEGNFWIAPNAVSGAGDPPRGRFERRARELVRGACVELRQGERRLWGGRVARLMPGRSARLPPGWASAVDPAGPPVVCALRRSG